MSAPALLARGMLADSRLGPDATDDDLQLQIQQACERERHRWSQAIQLTSRSANDVVFPFPELESGLECRCTCGKAECICLSLPVELQSLYKRFGTWDLPISAMSEAIELRASLPVELGSMPTRTSDLDISATELIFEADQWNRIAVAKQAERKVWGCFDSIEFQLPSEWVNPLMWDTSINPVAQFVQVSPSELRSAIHEDDTPMVTELADGASAWEVMPTPVLLAIRPEEWEASAAGGFCLREDPVFEPLKLVETPEDWCCAICLGEDVKGVVNVDCGHLFHQACITPWFRRSRSCPLCRARTNIKVPPVCNPPMDFVLDSWPMLPTGVIERDEVTQQQEDVLSARNSQASLSEFAIIAKRQKLAERFGCGLPSESFFEEVLPSQTVEYMSLIGPEAVAARCRSCQEQDEEYRLQMAELGSPFVAWPTNRTWPALPEEDTMTVRRQALTAKLQKRWQDGQSNSTVSIHRSFLPQENTSDKVLACEHELRKMML